MSGLCGFFSSEPIPDGPSRLERMLSASRMALSARSDRTVPGAALSVFGADAPAKLVERDGLTLAVIGHPIVDSNGSRTTDTTEIAEALRRDGAAGIRKLGGDFALAAWNAATSRGLLAVDRIGVRRLAYVRMGDALAFATTLDALTGYPGAQRRLSPQAMFDYLYFHVCPAPRSIYEDFLFLPPGHFIEFGQDGASAPQAYWSMQFVEGRCEKFGDLRHEFLETTRSAVADTAVDSTTGSFLSGGTDSSTVAGMLTRVRGEAASTFSIGFDAAGYDEMQYARIAVRHFGLDSHEYYVTPDDVVAALPSIAAFYDQPFANSSAVPSYYCARLARANGIGRLLAGDGGDELFGGNERYSRQYVLGLYHRLPAALRHALIEPLALSTSLRSLPGLRKIGRYVEQARPDMPWRYESYNLLNYLGPENVLEPDFLATIDRRHPQQLLQEVHRPYSASSLINQLQGIDLRFTLEDNDLRKVTGMCELAGVDVAFPLLDDRLVEFSARLQPDYKLKGSQLRWFFKEALRGFLPPEILAKQKHGFGLPVGDWLAGHAPLRNLATDSIRSLTRHRFIRPAFVDELLGPRLAEHPKYFGSMVWVLMILGLWLDSRGH
jgi:asparagine synthase (glutamine-hydrolysing)